MKYEVREMKFFKILPGEAKEHFESIVKEMPTELLPPEIKKQMEFFVGFGYAKCHENKVKKVLSDLLTNLPKTIEKEGGE